jgi:hypothetical protein
LGPGASSTGHSEYSNSSLVLDSFTHYQTQQPTMLSWTLQIACQAL